MASDRIPEECEHTECTHEPRHVLTIETEDGLAEEWVCFRHRRRRLRSEDVRPGPKSRYAIADGGQSSPVMEQARAARERAFCPYSEYAVGAALETEKGVYQGANIEVSGRPTSVHAEMMAAFKAVEDGATDFRTLAVTPEGQTGVAICGLCQHTLAQFCDDLLILEDVGDEEPVEYRLEELIGPAYSPSTRHPETVGDRDE